MDFVDNTGIHYFITNFKKWVINQINNWWKLLKLSHRYLDKSNWEYDIAVIANDDSQTKGKYPVVPKLYFYTTDWKTSKWSETSNSNYFPMSIAPEVTMENNSMKESSYTGSIMVNPAFGDITAAGIVTATTFKDSLKSGNILLADGSTKQEAKLSAQNVMTTNASMIQAMYSSSSARIITYTITNDQKNLLNGSGLGHDICFFKSNDNVIFQRCSRTYYNSNWENAMFVGYFMNTQFKLIKIIAKVMDDKIQFVPDNSSGQSITGPAFEIK